MKFMCTNCRQSLSAEPSLYGQELECPACFSLVQVPQPRRSSVSSKRSNLKEIEFSKAPAILLIVFSSLSCLSLMLPWVDSGFISASGFRKVGTENALIFMALMLLPLVGGICSLISGKYTSKVYAVFSVLAAILAVGLMLFFYSALSQNLESANAGTSTGFLKNLRLSLGIGFPLSCIFVAVTFLSTVNELFKERK